MKNPLEFVSGAATGAVTIIIGAMLLGQVGSSSRSGAEQLTSYTSGGAHYAVAWARVGDELQPVAKGAIPLPHNEIYTGLSVSKAEPEGQSGVGKAANAAESEYSMWRVRTRIRRQHESTGEWRAIERECEFRAKTAEEARELAKRRKDGCCWGPTPPWHVLGCEILEVTELDDE